MRQFGAHPTNASLIYDTLGERKKISQEVKTKENKGKVEDISKGHTSWAVCEEDVAQDQKWAAVWWGDVKKEKDQRRWF